MALIALITEIEIGIGQNDDALLVMPMCHANSLNFFCAFSYAGAVIEVVVGREQDQAGAWATLRVTNEGIGIPLEDLPELARPGHRGRNVGAIPGSGFGLASVREVVERCGGLFAIQSEPGGTTSALIRLPLAR